MTSCAGRPRPRRESRSAISHRPAGKEAVTSRKPGRDRRRRVFPRSACTCVTSSLPPPAGRSCRCGVPASAGRRQKIDSTPKTSQVRRHDTAPAPYGARPLRAGSMQVREVRRLPGPADRQRLPLLEDEDLTGEAVIEPSRLIRPVDAPAVAVACFFRDVVEELSSRADARPVCRLHSEMGPASLWEIEHRGVRLGVFHPGVGAPLAGEARCPPGCARCRSPWPSAPCRRCRRSSPAASAPAFMDTALDEKKESRPSRTCSRPSGSSVTPATCCASSPLT